MENENQFPKKEPNLPLNKPDGYKDTFTDESISQQSPTVQPTKADMQNVKIIAGLPIIFSLLFLAQSFPILVSIISGSLGIHSEMFRIAEVSAIFQLVNGIFLLITSVLLLRKSEFGRKLVILTAICMIVSEIYLISQEGSLFFWIIPFKYRFISLSLLIFMCYFLIRSVTSKEIKMLFAKPQQIVASKARPISGASVQLGAQVSMTMPEENDETRIFNDLKRIAFIGLVLGCMTFIYLIYKYELYYLFMGANLFFTTLDIIELIIVLLIGIGIFIGSIGLAKFKNWGRITFSLSAILFIIFLAKQVYESFRNWIVLSFFFASAIEIIMWLGIIVLIIFILKYIANNKVKRVCSGGNCAKK